VTTQTTSLPEDSQPSAITSVLSKEDVPKGIVNTFENKYGTWIESKYNFQIKRNSN
jgi:hypothetical protein